MDDRLFSKKARRNFIAALGLLVSSAIVAGCGGGSYGYIQRSREVGRMFENIVILPDHNYYYSGPDAIPYAVVGIHENYHLQSRYWKRIDLTKEQLSMWITLGMQGSLGFPPNGSYIYGPQGEKIGVWYSIFDGTVVRLLSDNQVMVYPPSSYPGQNAKPAIERGAVDQEPPVLENQREKNGKLSSSAF